MPSLPARSAPASAASASSHALAVLRSHSLTTVVQREIERMILEGALPAGSKLNEATLATQLGVSRGPVREAFRALEEQGLVRVEKNRGVFVRRLSLREADEIYELRGVLDAHIGRELARRASAEQVAELRHLLARLEQASRARDVDAYFALNLAFHDRMAELTGSRKLLETYRRLVKELSLFRREALAAGAATLAVPSREHREILAAIAARDEARAARLMAAHVEASRQRMHETHPEPASPAPRRATA